jgi:uncharacterized protein YdeI (BOF family)
LRDKGGRVKLPFWRRAKAVNSGKTNRVWLMLAVLLACSGLGAAQQSSPPQASAAAAAQKERSYLFVSPNTRENLTLAEALRNLNSPEERRLMKAARQIACRLGLRERVSKTLGSWTDGVEHSTLLRVEADEERARYAVAWLGRQARQKSVLYFQERATGTARLYVLSSQSRRRSLAAIAETLDRSGIKNRTLVPGAQRTLIYVVDFKDESRRQMLAAARQLGARSRVLRGTGDFIGDDSDRDKAQEVFSEIVSKFEREHAPARSRCAVEAEDKVISIAEARRLPLGTLVTIEGAVTVPSGAFKASINDEGFALQDVSGGIYVSVKANASLRVGQRARVTGKLGESMGLLLVLPEGAQAVRGRGAGAQVKPESVASGRVSEATEGRLVRVAGMITRAVVSDLPYGYRVFLNDGTGEAQVYVSASTRIDPSHLRPGQRLSATGFSGQYKDHYEVSPRNASDLSLRIWKRRPTP